AQGLPTASAPGEAPEDMTNAFTPPQQKSTAETVAAAGAFGQGQPVPAAAMPMMNPAAYQQAMMAHGMYPVPGGYPQGMYPQGMYPQSPMMPGYAMPPAGHASVSSPGYQGAMANRPPASEEMATPSGSTSAAQLSGVLKESMYPSQREWAATKLADYNGHTQP